MEEAVGSIEECSHASRRDSEGTINEEPFQETVHAITLETVHAITCNILQFFKAVKNDNFQIL